MGGRNVEKLKRVAFVLFFEGEDIPDFLTDLYSRMIHELGDRFVASYSCGGDVNRGVMEVELDYAVVREEAGREWVRVEGRRV